MGLIAGQRSRAKPQHFAQTFPRLSFGLWFPLLETTKGTKVTKY
jgi:hypothetical protein